MKIQGSIPIPPDSTYPPDSSVPDIPLPDILPPDDVKPDKCIPTEDETCNDGIDNNCNGLVDEGCRCIYKNGVGVCADGVLDGKNNCEPPKSYESTEKTCDNLDNDCNGQVDDVRVEEVCDGLDNDCNGKTDDIKDEDCSICGGAIKGKYVCGQVAGGVKKICDAVRPLEICGDDKSNDCDKPVDEICTKAKFPFAIVDKLGNSFQYRSVNSKTANRTFGAIHNPHPAIKLENRHYSCHDYVFIHSTEADTPHTSSHDCYSATWFRIVQGKFEKSSQTNLPKVTHLYPSVHVVIPTKGRWGRYVYESRKWGLKKSVNDKLKALEGLKGPGDQIDVRRKSTGHYEIVMPKSSSKYCADKSHPIFANIYGSSLLGYISARSNGQGTCEVRTFGSSGAPADLQFDFWIPPPKDVVAWATKSVSSMKTYNLGDDYAKWSVSSDPGSSGQHRAAKMLFPSFWQTPTVVLTTPRHEISYLHPITSVFMPVTTATSPVEAGVVISSYSWDNVVVAYKEAKAAVSATFIQ